LLDLCYNTCLMTQGDALSILKTGANAFLTGEPGAGKTHTVNAYIAWLRERGIEPSITASTGIAATHVGGMTIHAWSGLGIRDVLSGADLDAISSKEHIARRHQKATVLVIDEVSMLSGEVLTMVDRILKETRRSERAFGGLQVVLVGDFFQLPPVSKGGKQVSFAFQSDSWKALNPLPLYLHEQFRQDDEVLGRVLSNIRKGECDQSDVSCLMKRESDTDGVPEGTPRLYTHNADVDRENAERLAALPGYPKIFLMTASGAPPLIESLKRGCLSPERLELKEGATVMFTKNNPQSGYQNGTLGTVVRFERLGGSPVVELFDGREITVVSSEWAVEEGGKVRAKVEQMPLRLAWAITVHKSQGQSLDAAAMDLSRAFEYGQGYVALSRLRSLEGLHLLGWSENALMVHPEVSAKDGEFRDLSEQAAHIFDSLEESGERTRLEENFIRASGGSLTPSVGKKEKESTYALTLALVKEGNSLTEMAKARGMVAGTVAAHIEKLYAEGALSEKEVKALLSGKARENLADIHAAYEELGYERLAPAFSHLKKRFTFEDLKLARALYTK
jgi:ATP-dependent DNA helicase PIF1